MDKGSGEGDHHSSLFHLPTVILASTNPADVCLLMRRVYNNLTIHELSGFGSVTKLGSVILCLGLAVSMAGCATVSVYEPVSAEVTLTEEQSLLHRASEAFSKDARDKKLATGEASLSQLADMLSGKRSDQNAYWRAIGADRSSPAAVVTRVRDDMNMAARGLSQLDGMARGLIVSGDLVRDDVSAFEGALIHARQARDSFSDAIAQANKRAEAEYQIALELAPLDEALLKAGETADDLASARVQADAPAGS
jgi:hypothetical protein